MAQFNNEFALGEKVNDLLLPPVRVYIGCSWFNEQQREHLKKGLTAIEINPSISRKYSHIPLDFQYKGLDVAEHPELLHDVEWQARTFNSDIEGIIGADLCLMLYLPSFPDDGGAFELGYAKGIGKQSVMVVPDDDVDNLNLMLAYGVTRVIKLSELSTFDFRHIHAGTYKGFVH